MRIKRTTGGAIGAAVLVIALVSATAWAQTDGDPVPEGINADMVDGRHAGPSGGTQAQRADRVLWANNLGKLHLRALPLVSLDRRYLSASEDTLIYVPGSLMRFHMDDGALASARFNMTSQAIVRKEGSPGSIYVDIPIQLEAQQSGRWVKLVNMRIYYKVDNAASYIDVVRLHKINATGGHVTLAVNGTDGNSTAWSNLFVSCGDGVSPAEAAECQLSWPTGGFITVDLELKFAGTGAANEIEIGGVLMRVSYDG